MELSSKNVPTVLCGPMVLFSKDVPTVLHGPMQQPRE
jgi:hypothetical protein